MTVQVMFVCLGNICRSPTAHGVFEHKVAQRGLAKRISVESSGTGDWHVGEPPDRRATRAASNRGYDITHLRAQQLHAADFERFDYILAMDRENLRNIEAMRPHDFQGEIGLFLLYGDNPDYEEVPDPYYGGIQGFDLVLDLIEAASEGLLANIRQQHGI